MGKLLRFGFKADTDQRTIEEDLALAIFSTECVYGKPRVRMEASYLVAEDGKICVLDISGESGEAAARIFTGLVAVRFGEDGFTIQRLPSGILPREGAYGGPKQ